MKFRLAGVVILLLLAILSPGPATQKLSNTRPVAAATPITPNGEWTVYHHDDAHTGFDPVPPLVSSVTPGWTSVVLDGAVFAEPLVEAGIVFVATLNNTVYALNQTDGSIVWQTHLTTPKASGWTCGNVSPQGILGTPVIDAAAQRIYVATFSSDNTYRVVALDLRNGNPLWSFIIPNTIGTGFTWQIQQQRGALALHNGYVYVPFGGRAGDCGTYHGFVVAVSVSGSGVPPVYQTPSSGSGIWTAGGVVVDDATGNVFVATGNAVSGGCSAANQNDAVVKLSSTLALQDYFMPQDWQSNWCSNDADLGSAAPLLISSNLIFQSGKWGGGFLLNPSNLGWVDGQRFPTPKPAAYSQAEACFGDHSDATFGSFAFAAPYIYVECEGLNGHHALVALHLDTSNPALPTFTPCDATCGAPNWFANGDFGPPIVAAGAVWAAGPAGLAAYNSITGALIYQSLAFGINRFGTPAEAGGHVFVGSGNVIRSFDMHFTQVGTSLAGNLTSGPGAASWASNREDVFARGTSNDLIHKWWDGGQWSGWESLGGYLSSDPGAISWGPNRIDVFMRGADNALWHRWWDGLGWSAPESLGGSLSSGPEAASWSSGRLDVFARGPNLELLHKWWDGRGWSGWENLGGVLTTDPGAVSWAPNRIDVVARGADNKAYHAWWDGAHWGSESLGGFTTIAADPAISSCSPVSLDLFMVGSDLQLWRQTYRGAWSGWQPVGGHWGGGTAAVCRPSTSNTDVFVLGTDSALWHVPF